MIWWLGAGCVFFAGEGPPCWPAGGADLPEPGNLCIARDLSGKSDVAAAVDLVADLGTSGVRSDLLWHRVQPERDAWEFERYDALFDALQARGLGWIAMLGYGAPWASSQTEDDHHYPPDDPADYALFAGTVAARYAGHGMRYELWNEPNAGWRFFKPDMGGDAVAWGALVVAAEEAIHAADPTAQVIAGGTFFHDQLIPGGVEFLEEAVEAWPELLDRVDAVGVHPYTLYPPRAAPESDEDGEIPAWEMYAAIREVTGDVPLVVTEYGWPSWGDVDEDEQAAWLQRGALIALAEGVQDVCWYTIWDGSDPSESPEAAFGLLRADGEEKPAAGAFRELSEHLAESDIVSWVRGLPDGAWGVHLGDGGTALWGEGEVCEEPVTEMPRWD